MSNRTIATQDAPKAIGPYSQAIERDGWVYCSGQIALDPATGQLSAGDVREQTERVLQNLKAVLAAAECSMGDVVKTTVFLANLDDFGAMNEVYGKAFPTNPPARSTIQAARLPRGALVEIDAVARRAK
jgi:2-iminobutanoate/2-iminopropanoate deaminase